MESIIHADIFFFITSIFVLVLIAVLAVAGFYLIGAMRNFRDMSRIVKRGAENAEENIEEAWHDLEDSAVFRFLFGRRRSHDANKKKVPSGK